MIRRGCSNFGTILFLLLFVAVGVGISYWGWGILRNASVSAGWPSVNGEVIHARVSESSDSDGTTYGADIYFEYTVDDRPYGSDQVSFGEYSSSNYGRAQEIVNRYPAGTLVRVYYDPADPDTAVLEPGVTWSSYMVLVMGLMFVCLPGIGVVAMLGRAVGLLSA